MAEYIEREAINRICFMDYFLVDGEVRTESVALVRDIEKLPAADVAPVVRCRNCEHSYDDPGGLICSYGVCVDCVVPPGFLLQLRRENGRRHERMICFYVLAILAELAGAAEDLWAASGEELAAMALWALCDIELCKFIFGRGKARNF